MSMKRTWPICRKSMSMSRCWAGLRKRRPEANAPYLGNAPDYLSDDGILICEVGNSMVHLMEQYPDVPFTASLITAATGSLC